MNTRTRTMIAIALLGIGLTGCAPSRDPGAQLVLTNARIYTVNSEAPWAEAVAIQDGKFVYVGGKEGAERFVGEATRKVDLAGRFVLPGLIDGHTHPGYIGVEQFAERLPNTGHDDMMAAVRERSANQPGEDWLRLCCWSPRSYVSGRNGPNKEDLDAVISDRPVWINSRSWHSYWLNSKALEVLGIDENSADPRPGVAVYDRDENGQLTGWVKEGAGWQHFSDIFKIDVEQHQESMRAFLNTLSEHGVTTVYDGGNFGYEDEVYSFLAELERAGELPLRYEGTYQIFVPARRHLAIAEMRRLQKSYGGERLRFRTVKLFMDGINTNRTGAMLEPYSDIPGSVSETMLSTAELRDFLLELHKEKLDLHVHVVGDLAVRSVLDAVEAAQAAVSGEFYPRVTLAHLHQVAPADLPRFAQLGVTANFTAWWHRMGRGDGSDPVLGSERHARLFDVKALLDAGANVTSSSDDWRLHVLSPFLGMQTGHVRRAPTGSLGDSGTEVTLGADNPPLSRMIEAYTRNGAYPFRMEDQIGSIEVGKIADLIVLDQNLFEMDKNAIHKIKPSVVIMEGRVLHGDLSAPQK